MRSNIPQAELAKQLAEIKARQTKDEAQIAAIAPIPGAGEAYNKFLGGLNPPTTSVVPTFKGGTEQFVNNLDAPPNPTGPPPALPSASPKQAPGQALWDRTKASIDLIDPTGKNPLSSAISAFNPSHADMAQAATTDQALAPTRVMPPSVEKIEEINAQAPTPVSGLETYPPRQAQPQNAPMQGGYAGGGGSTGGGASAANGFGLAEIVAPLDEQAAKVRQASSELQTTYQNSANAATLDAERIKGQEDAFRIAEADRQDQQKKYEAAFLSSVKDLNDVGEVDPYHWWNSRSDAGKVGTVIGGLLWGLGMSIAGHPEKVGEFMDKVIDRDLAAQKANFERTKEKSNAIHNLYSAAMQRTGDERQAFLLAKATMLDGIAADAAARSQKVAGANANVDTEKFLATLAQKKTDALLEAWTRFMTQKHKGGGGGGIGGVAPEGTNIFDPGQIVWDGPIGYIGGGGEQTGRLQKIVGASNTLTSLKTQLAGELQKATTLELADLARGQTVTIDMQTNRGRVIRQLQNDIDLTSKESRNLGAAYTTPEQILNRNANAVMFGPQIMTNRDQALKLINQSIENDRAAKDRGLQAASSFFTVEGHQTPVGVGKGRELKVAAPVLSMSNLPAVRANLQQNPNQPKFNTPTTPITGK